LAVKPINIHEAKTHLSRLVERVQAGEEFVIAKAGRPAARLVPLEARTAPVKTGGLRIPGGVPDDFDTMFAEEIETLFSGPAAQRAAKARRRR
jgi:prevent-host-death family protein